MFINIIINFQISPLKTQPSKDTENVRNYYVLQLSVSLLDILVETFPTKTKVTNGEQKDQRKGMGM